MMTTARSKTLKTILDIHIKFQITLKLIEVHDTI